MLSLNLAFAVESGTGCGQRFLHCLWAPSENELAVATTTRQAVGLGGRGRTSLHTHLGSGPARREPGTLGRARGDASWQPVIWPPAPGLAGTGVLSPSNRQRGADIMSIMSIRRNKVPFLPWLPQPARSGTGGGEEKRTQLKTGPRPSILRLEDVGCTYIHLRLFLTCSPPNLFMRGEQEKKHKFNF